MLSFSEKFGHLPRPSVFRYFWWLAFVDQPIEFQNLTEYWNDFDSGSLVLLHLKSFQRYAITLEFKRSIRECKLDLDGFPFLMSSWQKYFQKRWIGKIKTTVRREAVALQRTNCISKWEQIFANAFGCIKILQRSWWIKQERIIKMKFNEILNFLSITN